MSTPATSGEYPRYAGLTRGALRYVQRGCAPGTRWRPHDHLAPPPALRQAEHEPQDEDGQVDALPGVGDDPEPGAAESPAREGEEQHSLDGATQDAPRLVQVIEAEQEPIQHPIPPAEGARHPGQEESAKEQFFPHEGI